MRDKRINDTFGENMNIIALVNQKGGVGKTTSTINLGAALAKKAGKKVLLIDLDPQAHLSISLGFRINDDILTLYDRFKAECLTPECIHQIKELSIISGGIKLSGIDAEFSNTAGRDYLLKEILEEVEDQFDYVLIDCPPSLGFLTLNALTAANKILVVLQTEYLALEGMSKLLNTVKTIQKRTNPDLKVLGILPTLFDKRKALHRDVLSEIKKNYASWIFNSIIHTNVELAEAPSFEKHILDYKPKARGSKDYTELAMEIEEKIYG